MKLNKKGFTIVELLVITGILVLCGGLIAGIIFSTLQGSKKSSNTNQVTQSGNYALSVITETVNKADQVVSSCNNTPSQSLLLYSSQTDSLYTISCLSGTNITIEETNRSTGLPVGSQNTLLGEGVRLSGSSCSFTCNQVGPSVTGAASPNPYLKPVIQVSFMLTDPGQSTAADVRAQINFRTSIYLRNFQP